MIELWCIWHSVSWRKEGLAQEMHSWTCKGKEGSSARQAATDTHGAQKRVGREREGSRQQVTLTLKIWEALGANMKERTIKRCGNKSENIRKW